MRKPREPAQTPAALLQGLAARASVSQMRAFFELVRTHADADLLALAAKAKRRIGKEPSPPGLTRRIAAILKPILAPASEKAELLIEHMAQIDEADLGRFLLDPPPRGLSDAIKRLRPRFSDEDIEAGALGLIAKLSRTHSMREQVL